MADPAATLLTVSVVSISYHDLVRFNKEFPDQDLVENIGKAFGDSETCLGILAVTDIPRFQVQRQALLPLAVQLPALPDLEACESPESFYSTGWSHGREQLAPGKPDLSKGSYYSNPLAEDLAQALAEREGETRGIEHWKEQATKNPSFYAANVWPASLPSLQPAVCEMGRTVQQTGCLLAAVCDAYCHARGVATSLQQTLTESLNAKARLLHYFDASSAATGSSGANGEMWCGWHNDHSSLTGLVPAIYIDSTGKTVPCPDPAAGLYIQARSGKQVKVRLPSNACGFQIGETSQIQSGGLLQATPHAVKPARNCPGVTREAFAVFLEPEFDAPLAIPVGKTMEDCQAESAVLPPTVLPVKSRWKLGQTFGDFHNATIQAFSTTS